MLRHCKRESVYGVEKREGEGEREEGGGGQRGEGEAGMWSGGINKMKGL